MRKKKRKWEGRIGMEGVEEKFRSRGREKGRWMGKANERDRGRKFRWRDKKYIYKVGL